MEVKRQSILPMRTTGDWICAIMALITGSVAYINTPGFLQIDPVLLNNGMMDFLQKAGEITWAALVAGVTTISGLATKYWWDKRGKRMFDKLFKRRRR